MEARRSPLLVVPVPPKPLQLRPPKRRSFLMLIPHSRASRKNPAPGIPVCLPTTRADSIGRPWRRSNRFISSRWSNRSRSLAASPIVLPASRITDRPLSPASGDLHEVLIERVVLHASIVGRVDGPVDRSAQGRTRDGLDTGPYRLTSAAG